LLSTLKAEQYLTQTQFKQWDFNDVIGHLYFWNCAVLASLVDESAFRAMVENIGEAVERDGLRACENRWIENHHGKLLEGPDLLQAWRTQYYQVYEQFDAADPKARLPWVGPDMSVRSSITARQMETWAHGQAIYDAFGIRRQHDRGQRHGFLPGGHPGQQCGRHRPAAARRHRQAVDERRPVFRRAAGRPAAARITLYAALLMPAHPDLSIEGPVARILLNYPKKHNSLSAEAIKRFVHQLDEVQSSSDVRVLVITGSGEQSFCSGVALEQIAGGEIDLPLFKSLTDRIADLPIPKIASMNGNTFGGGVEVGLACDFRIGVDDMRLMVPAARFGLCYPIGGIERFVHRLGLEPAKRLLVGAETVDAKTLLGMGYLHAVAPRDELGEVTARWIERIAGLAPLAVHSMLKICDQVASGNLDEAEAQTLYDRCNSSEDLAIGFKAALGKYKPEFTGR
jgi:uncharacterized protein (TIGR03083 family)